MDVDWSLRGSVTGSQDHALFVLAICYCFFIFFKVNLLQEWREEREREEDRETKVGLWGHVDPTHREGKDIIAI